MKKRIKKIIVLCMALAMLFGNVLTVSASEATEKNTFENSLRKYFTLTKSFDMVGGDTNIDRYKVVRYEFSEPVYVGIFHRYRPDLDGDYFNVWMISEKENVKYGDIINNNISEEYLQGYLGREIELDSTLSGRFVADGKTYYYMKLDCSFYDGYNSTLPVYACPAEYPELGSPERLVEAFSSGYKFTQTGISDSSLAEFDENLDFVNLRFKELNGTPKSHSFKWDSNSAYDENTYVTIHCDIKYRPILGTLHSISDYGWLTRFDEYPATSLSYTCLCTEPVESYFKINNIDWSSFNTQWVDCYYLQVLKYHPDTDAWTKSNIWYIDPVSNTTGTVSGGDAYIGKADKNELTGEYEKDTGYRVDPETGEIVSNPIDDVFGDITSDSSISGYFSGLWNFFIKGFRTLADGLGEIPQLVSSVVSFLPPSVITLLGLSVVVCIILRIVGR